MGIVRAYNRLIFIRVFSVVAALSFSSCEQEQAARGQLILTFQTDMALPEQIDTVLVQVTRSNDQVVYKNEYQLGDSRGQKTVPGTFALVAGESREPFTITVAGKKESDWRTYREVVTTVPQDRVAELRMPIQWLCDESAKPQPESRQDEKGRLVSRVVQNCDQGMTCKAGTCQSSDMDSTMLPDYKPAALFGGADDPKQGSCFDVLECMGSGNVVEPDAQCTIAAPTQDNFNVALRVAGGGICNEMPSTACFVPLDGNSDEGWKLTADGTRLQLPTEVCRRIAEHRVLAVQTSTACRTKDPSLPPCGAWSSVPNDHSVMPDPTAMVATWPSPEVVTTFTNGSLCCPLMSDASSVYSCMCKEDGTATVYALDLQSQKSEMFALDVRPQLAATVFGKTLYWAGYAADRSSQLFQVALQAGAKPKSFKGRGGLYVESVLLADDTGIHALTSGVGSDMDKTSMVVQLLHFSKAGDVTGMDPLGNSVVPQIAQDNSAFYSAMNVDDTQADGSPIKDKAFKRVSSVVRIDKVTHQRDTLLNARTMMITNFKFNGYLGVVSDNTNVFALFETEPKAGFESLQIMRVSQAASAAASDPTPIYDLSVSADQHLTRLRLLGAVDGTVLFARDEFKPTDNVEKPLLVSSSVLLIPQGSTSARFIADFTGDLPLPGIAANAKKVFWLNQTGRVFALSREALAP